MTASRARPSGSLITIRRPFVPSTSNPHTVKGIDTVDGRIIAVDTGGGVLRQSSDWASSWSNSKGFPTNVAWNVFGPVVRFGSYLYAVGYDSVAGTYGVYRAAPAAGNTPFSWSSQLLTYTSGSSTLLVNVTTDDTYIYASEYGDPSGGPSLYRSSDGTSWETILGPKASWRHIHCVAADPFNPGHVWLTSGDGVADPILYSTDYGSNWTAVSAGVAAQCIGIAFSEQWVFLGADAEYSSIVVIDKATKTARFASPNFHANIAIPGSSDVFHPSNVFYVAVDSSTGVCYFATPTEGSYPTSGLFYLSRPGSDVRLLTYGESTGYLLVANGRLWSGAVNRSLIELEDVL